MDPKNENPGSVVPPAENSVPPVETRPDPGLAEQIAAVMPPVGDGEQSPAGAVAPAKPGLLQKAFGAFKKKPGRPRKPDSELARPRSRNGKREKRNPFAAPENLPQAPAETPAGNPGQSIPAAGAASVPEGGTPGNVVQVDFQPPANAEDFAAYGRAGGSLVAGVYSIRAENTAHKCRNKIPKQNLDRFRSRVAVPDPIREDLEDFYAVLAEDMGLPAKGGRYARGIAGHVSLELHFRAALNELLAVAEKLPDLPKDKPTAPAAPAFAPSIVPAAESDDDGLWS